MTKRSNVALTLKVREKLSGLNKVYCEDCKHFQNDIIIFGIPCWSRIPICLTSPDIHTNYRTKWETYGLAKERNYQNDCKYFETIK